jgi:RimJ/RimL family protein N-acetyltransferase
VAIEGTTIRLREEKADDVDFLTALRNDLDTQAWPKSLPPHYTREMLAKRYEAREFSFEPEEGRFIIEEKDTGDRVGFVGYMGLQPRFSASLGVMVAKHFWGSGYAFEANDLLLGFMFEELGLRIVRLWTHSLNHRAIALAEKLGFQTTVQFRNSIYRDGQLGGSMVMDITRQEFYATRYDRTDNLPDPFV